jgi:hypothetical protein
MIIAYPYVVFGDMNYGWMRAVHPCDPDARAGGGTLSARRRLKIRAIGVARARAVERRGTEIRSARYDLVSGYVHRSPDLSIDMHFYVDALPIAPEGIVQENPVVCYGEILAAISEKHCVLGRIHYRDILHSAIHEPGKCQQNAVWDRGNCGAISLEIMQMNIPIGAVVMAIPEDCPMRTERRVWS